MAAFVVSGSGRRRLTQWPRRRISSLWWRGGETAPLDSRSWRGMIAGGGARGVGSRREESSWREMESSAIWVRWLWRGEGCGDGENPRERVDCGWVKSILRKTRIVCERVFESERESMGSKE